MHSRLPGVTGSRLPTKSWLPRGLEDGNDIRLKFWELNATRSHVEPWSCLRMTQHWAKMWPTSKHVDVRLPGQSMSLQLRRALLLERATWKSRSPQMVLSTVSCPHREQKSQSHKGLFQSLHGHHQQRGGEKLGYVNQITYYLLQG